MKQISENRSLWSSLSPRVRSCGEAEADGLKTKIKDRTKTVDNIARYPPVTVAIAILAAPRSSVSPPPLVAGGGGVSLAARPHVVRSADVPQKLHRVFVLNMTKYD